jgi:hypothetical protein
MGTLEQVQKLCPRPAYGRLGREARKAMYSRRFPGAPRGRATGSGKMQESRGGAILGFRIHPIGQTR